MPPRRRPGRKILVATIGVATLNYVAVSCGGSSSTGSGTDAAMGDTGSDHIDEVPVANLVAIPPDAIEEFPVANLVAIPPDALDDFPVANLVAPPMDAGKG
jgi:hypothetical protein